MRHFLCRSQTLVQKPQGPLATLFNGGHSPLFNIFQPLRPLSMSSPESQKKFVYTKRETPFFVLDLEYYKEDGDFTILVESTLFKVHRFLLSRDSSAFADMFKDAVAPRVSGRDATDEGPLLLADSCEELSALCWALYALPTEVILQEDDSTINIPRLANLAIIANKYHFVSYERWSIAALVKCAQRQSFRFLEASTVTLLRQVLTAAILCNEPALQEQVESAWISRLQWDETMSTADALAFGERHGLRRFQGKVYYEALLKMKPIPAENSTAFARPEISLTSSQAECLQQGYFSLSNYLKRLLFVNPPQIVKCPACPDIHHASICKFEWDHQWSTIVYLFMQKEETVNPRSAILEMRTRTNQCPSTHPGCIQASAAGLSTILAHLDATLPDHFLGPTPIPTSRGSVPVHS